MEWDLNEKDLMYLTSHNRATYISKKYSMNHQNQLLFEI